MNHLSRFIKKPISDFPTSLNKSSPVRIKEEGQGSRHLQEVNRRPLPPSPTTGTQCILHGNWFSGGIKWTWS